MSDKMEEKTMKPAAKRTLVPKLRFPEFRSAEEWEKVQLSQLGKLISGLTYRPDDIRDKGLLVLRSSNIKNGEISLEDCVYVNPDIKGANPSKPNDILICVRNGSIALIGKNAIVPEGLPLSTHGAFMTVFRSETAQFVFQLFQTSAYHRQVAANLGATINSINGSQLLRYKFFVPKRPEQQKIADCLSSLDELITAEAQKLDTLKRHKKGLMQQLFPAEGETLPRLRFPEFQDAGEWEREFIHDLGEIVTGSTPSTTKPEYYGGARLFVSPADISGQRFIEKTKTTLTELGFSQIRPIKEGSILFVCIGSTIGKVAQNLYECATNQQINSIIPREDYSNAFIYYALENSSAQISELAGNHAVPIINKTAFGSIEITLPRFPEQQKIADCLSSVDELIAAQTQKLDTLKRHKKGLMQQLFPAFDEVQG